MPTAQNWLILLKFDGTSYHGWQIQPNLATVEGSVEQAIKNLWIKPTARVIHAPHSMNHFRILLNVLGFGEKMVQTRYGLRPFCELATLEIRRSRGEAIQTGLNEHEIVDEVLNNLLNEIVLNYDPKKIKYVFNKDLLINGRKSSIKRCLTNIIDNGISYGDVVTISTKKTNNNINIVIDDNGGGIPEKEHQNVFKPFYRIDKSRSQNKSGVGLGLSIANDIIRSHGGNIFLDQSPNKGLRVKISLPF